MPSKRPTPHFKEGFKRANVDPVSSAIYTYDTKNVKPISPAAPATQQFLHNSNATATTQQVPNCYATATQQLRNSYPIAPQQLQQLLNSYANATQHLRNRYQTATQPLPNSYVTKSTHAAPTTQHVPNSCELHNSFRGTATAKQLLHPS